MEFFIAAIAVLLWFLASPRMAPGLYSRWLFRPKDYCGSKEDEEAFLELGGREIYFHNRRGNRLHGWLLGEDRAGQEILLYCMGNDGDIFKRAHILALLLETGLPIFIFEYSGFGKSAGKVSIENICLDAIDAFDFVTTDMARQPHRVILYGESLGGAVSVNLTRHRQPGGVVLKSTFSSLWRIARELCPILRVYPQWFIPQLNTVKHLKEWHDPDCPLLMVHGKGDRKIGWRHAERLFKAAPEPKTMLWLPDSRHAFMEAQDEQFFLKGIQCFVALVASLGDEKAAALQAEIIADLKHAVGSDSAQQIRQESEMLDHLSVAYACELHCLAQTQNLPWQ